MRNFLKNYLKEFVYGALDGTVTTFAIIAGSAGANLDSSIVLILGISNVLADGFSMASSNYLAEKSDREKSIKPIDGVKEANTHPLRMAYATFISFIIVGSVPLLPYLFDIIFGVSSTRVFLFSCIFTSAAFIFIGQVRAKITRQNKFIASFETVLIGGVAALVAYTAGALLDKIV